MPLVEVDGCVYDAEQLGLSHGYESEDPVGRESFVNHQHLSGPDRVATAEGIIRSWAAELGARWPDREFRIYRHSDSEEVTVRFHMVRVGLDNWWSDEYLAVIVGGLDAGRSATAHSSA